MPQRRGARAETFNEIFRAYERSDRLPAMMRAALDETMPAAVQPYSFVTLAALREIAHELRLTADEVLVDLACGRGGPGMWVARATGARLVGVDFSTVAIEQAERRAAVHLPAAQARFLIGDLSATGLPDASADGLMCVDSLHFAADIGEAAREAWRILRPGRRLVLTNWEPHGPPGQLPEIFARLDFTTLLADAGFVQIQVSERKVWHHREFVLLSQVLAADPGDDPGLRILRAEAIRTLPLLDLLRRVIVIAVRPPG